MMRNRVALLTALGVDNVGSGLFLPVALLYVTRVVGLPLATAGTVVAIGTMAGLAVPPVAGRLVDRVGPRLTVISAQSLQALGAAAYLVARNPASVAVAAVLLGSPSSRTRPASRRARCCWPWWCVSRTRVVSVRPQARPTPAGCCPTGRS
jgi:MFS family permease